MHGTVEWLPGQPLGNDRKSWSDELLGDLPNIYIYAVNNPSGKSLNGVLAEACALSPHELLGISPESILAKRRGYGTIVSYNVPPYGRAGLYLELANLKELVDEYRTASSKDGADKTLCQTIYDSAQRSGMVNDVPLLQDSNDKSTVFKGTDLPDTVFESGAFAVWILHLSDYLNILQDRLFSSGLRYVTLASVCPCA
jgi:magnesium chelatase subunit H